MFKDSEKLLRFTLIANGMFSAISGIALIVFSEIIAREFALNYSYSQTGISLLIFSVIVIYAGYSPIKSTLIRIIIGMDVLWVIGSVILLISPVGLSSFGNWTIIIVSIIVADFALFQYRGLQRVTLTTTKESNQNRSL